MSRRHSKLPLGLRIVAAGCIAVWLAAVSACSLEAFFGCDGHEHKHETEAVAQTEHDHSPESEATEAEEHHAHSDDAEAHHSHEVEGHPHGSHKHDDKGNSCCSTLKANVLATKPFVFNKPAFQTISFLCVLLETRTAALAFSDKPPNRHTESGEWVFTPEVCTGPANRSHAPPASV